MAEITVRAIDSALAMEEVQKRLGDDALIISTQRIDGQIEITATDEEVIKSQKDEKSNGRCVCIATIKIKSDNVIFKTKNVSSKAIGSGNTSIATRAIIPNGNSELIKFGPKPLKVID